MIHVSKISVPFPGFTPGTAKQTMSEANLLGAMVLWYSIKTMVYQRESPLPGDSPLACAPEDSTVFAADTSVVNSLDGVTVLAQEEDVVIAMLPPGSHPPTKSRILWRGSCPR